MKGGNSKTMLYTALYCQLQSVEYIYFLFFLNEMFYDIIFHKCS